MFLNSNIQNRVKHYDLLLSRELAYLKREHSQNLITYQKLENTIRRDSKQIFLHNRRKLSTPLDYIYNDQIDSFDYHKLSTNGNMNQQKRRLSSSTSSNYSHNQLDDFDDETISYTSSKQRRYSTKNQRLPPVIKTNLSEQSKRKTKTQHWMTNFQQTKRSKENSFEPFRILIEETSNPILPEPAPLQRQIRSFLDTLPTYKGIQNGFDNFAPSSLYSNRSSLIVIR
ncbi:hypothetical protein I4U23_021282 [Adineta vaga]|nr:hypothetical protein I4U23_021282 [Adineta vaga]